MIRCTAQGFKDAYVRAVAWRGSEMMAISAQQTTTHVAVVCLGHGVVLRSRKRGWRASSCSGPSTSVPSPECAPVHAKAAGLYMICTVSKHEAEAARGSTTR